MLIQCTTENSLVIISVPGYRKSCSPILIGENLSFSDPCFQKIPVSASPPLTVCQYVTTVLENTSFPSSSHKRINIVECTALAQFCSFQWQSQIRSVENVLVKLKNKKQESACSRGSQRLSGPVLPHKKERHGTQFKGGV